MQIALVNGSPKYKDSASNAILKDLESCLVKYSNNTITYFSFQKNNIDNDTLTSLFQQDVIIFSFPLYVDGIPSHFLSCLVEMEQYLQYQKNENNKIIIYSIVNCGFYEGKQNRLAIEMIKYWTKRTKLQWGQGLGIGAGGMLGGLKNVPLGSGPKKNLGMALLKFSQNIAESKSEDTLLINANFPRILYKLFAEAGWRRTVKLNGLKRKNLFYQFK